MFVISILALICSLFAPLAFFVQLSQSRQQIRPNINYSIKHDIHDEILIHIQLNHLAQQPYAIESIELISKNEAYFIDYIFGDYEKRIPSVLYRHRRLNMGLHVPSAIVNEQAVSLYLSIFSSSEKLHLRLRFKANSFPYRTSWLIELRNNKIIPN